MQDCKECFSISPGRGEVIYAHAGVSVNHPLTPQQQRVLRRRVVTLTRHKHIADLDTQTYTHMSVSFLVFH